MALISLTEGLTLADRAGSALGAFNISCWEMAPATISAAEELQTPVVLQVQWPFCEYAGVLETARFLLPLADCAKVPVVVQLDHGKAWKHLMSCLRAGFSSVMIDASQLPFEENIQLVSAVVKTAHGMGVSVESELGKVAGQEGTLQVAEDEATFTDPDEAAEFIARTEVDALAVSVGTVHGAYRGEPRLDFARLQDINRKTDVHLVLHGASGVPAEALQQALSLGVRKVNFSTELKQAWFASIRVAVTDQEADPLDCIRAAQAAVKAVVTAKLLILSGI